MRTAKRLTAILLALVMVMTGFLIQAPQDAKAAEGEVVSISYTRAFPYETYLEQDFHYDEETGEYHCYDTSPGQLDGDTMTVSYSDGSETVYVYDMDEGSYISTTDNEDRVSDSEVTCNISDYQGAWRPDGDENYYVISYAGVSCQVPVLVMHVPVKSVELQLAFPRFHYANGNSAYGLATGDTVIITFTDGTVKTFVFDWDADPVLDPEYSSSYSYGWGAFVCEETGEIYPENHPYDSKQQIGFGYDPDRKEYYASYMGVRDYTEGGAYFAKSMTFTQAKPRTLLEENDGVLREDANGEGYYYYNFDEYNTFAAGDKLTVTYENNLGEEQVLNYTYLAYEGGFLMDDIGDGRDFNRYIGAGNLSLTLPDQETSHLVSGSKYTCNVHWTEDVGEAYQAAAPDMTTQDNPYTITVKGNTIANPGTINSFSTGQIWNRYIELSFDPYVSDEQTADRYMVTASYQGNEIFNSRAYLNADNKYVTQFSMYAFEDTAIFEEGKDYPLIFKATAYNADNQVIASSELPITVSVTDVEETLNEASVGGFYGDTSADMTIGMVRYLNRSVNADVKYHWTIGGGETAEFTDGKSVGEIVSVTSSNNNVVAVNKDEDEGEYWIKTVGAGTATITINYTAYGETKTKTSKLTVADQYLRLAMTQNGTLRYYDMPVGSTVSYTLSAYLYTYNKSTGSYQFAGDVTSQTTFSKGECYFMSEGGKDTSGLSVTVKKNVMTVKATKEGYFNITATGTYKNAKGAYGEEMTSFADGYHLVPNADFLFPLAGKSSKLSPKLVHYANGTETETPIVQAAIRSSGLTIKDKSGAEVTGDTITGSQLPITITSNGDEYPFIRISAQDENGKDLAYIYYTGEGDIFNYAVLKPSKTSMVYTGKALKPGVTLSYGSDKLPLSDYNVSYYKNTAIGTATILLTEKDNSLNMKTVTFKIVPPSTSITSITPKASGFTLKWKKVPSAAGYKIYRNNKLIKTITKNSTITYTDAAAKANGTKYTYKIYAYKTVDGVTYTSAASAAKSAIFLSRPAISSLKNTAAKTITIKWKKNAKSKGYQIQYAKNSKFTGAKTVNITKAATVKKVVKNLTKGKTYYVRIRSKNGSSYSMWSAVKKVKITK